MNLSNGFIKQCACHVIELLLFVKANYIQYTYYVDIAYTVAKDFLFSILIGHNIMNNYAGSQVLVKLQIKTYSIFSCVYSIGGYTRGFFAVLISVAAPAALLTLK